MVMNSMNDGRVTFASLLMRLTLSGRQISLRLASVAVEPRAAEPPGLVDISGEARDLRQRSPLARRPARVHAESTNEADDGFGSVAAHFNPFTSSHGV